MEQPAPASSSRSAPRCAPRAAVGALQDLLSAFRQDVHGDALRDVDGRARLLPPVGESGRPARPSNSGHRDAELDEASDSVCTALQLTNFWQDLAVDWERGRLYVPSRESARGAVRDLDRRGCHPPGASLPTGAAARATCSPGDVPCATACAAGCVGSCGHVAGRQARARSRGEAVGFDVFSPAADAGRIDAAPMRGAPAERRT